MEIKTSNTVRSNSMLGSWARLVRLHTALATALIPMITYMTVKPLDYTDGIIILSIAALLHTGVCAMNDYMDYEDDKNDPEKTIRPLVSGEIKPNSALNFSIISILFSIILAATVGIYAFLATLVGAVSATLYNYYSAKTAWADIMYVVAIISAASLGPAIAGNYTDVTLLITAALFIHGFYQVQEGHMKDLKEEENNVIQYIGVNVNSNNRIHYPILFIGMTYLLKILELALILYSLYLVADIVVYAESLVIIIFGISLIVNVMMYFASLNQWLVNTFSRVHIVKYITLHEISSVMIILICVMPNDPVSTVTLIIVTPIYLVVTNYLIHRDMVSPDI